MRYIVNILIGIDQLINTFLGGAPDETLSAYAYRQNDWRMDFINRLFFWQENHCKDAFDSEIRRKQYPSPYRDINSEH